MDFGRLACVFVGAGLGAVLRWQLAAWLNPLVESFLLGTLVVNILGSAVAGGVAVLAAQRTCSPEMQLLLLVGFAGGLSTMAALSVEAVEGMERGACLASAGLAFAHLACSFGAAWAGMALARRLVAA